MYGPFITISSLNYSIDEELDTGVLKDIDNKELISINGKGGDGFQFLANVIRNEIFMTFAGIIAGEIIKNTIETVYKNFKNKKSKKAETFKNNPNVIFVGGDLVIHVTINGDYIGVVGDKNINTLDEKKFDELVEKQVIQEKEDNSIAK